MVHLFETPIKKTSPETNPTAKAALGQYMTPPNIAAYMASLLPKISDEFHLLDAGAGEGSLTCAFFDAVQNSDGTFPAGEVSLFELDAALMQKLEENMDCILGVSPVQRHIYHTDFIEYAAAAILRKQRPFTHALLNPPYKKINNRSHHRALLRNVGIETVNLYTAFVALAVAMMQPGGTLVAIIPRSFCNGPYYKPFRELIMRHAAIRHIHLFTSRTEAFKPDNVLQENVIIKLECASEQADILISSSTNGDMDDYNTSVFPFADIVNPCDSEKFIHIPAGESKTELLSQANETLASLGIDVSTGPVVDFRLKEFLREMPQGDDAPLLYPGHFNGKAQWPKSGFKKPNAITHCSETLKWLYPNGYYVIVRRLSSKEEKRRIVAYLVDPALFPGKPYVGFENHLNIFHSHKHGLDGDVAHGLTLYLNSHFIDTLFRRFNGHTQVNATDLRALPYPSTQKLAEIGRWAKAQKALTQETVEKHLEAVGVSGKNTLGEALEIIKALGMPRAQHNERSALCLLALCAMTPGRKWSKAEAPYMGITPIMDWAKEHYGTTYAPNTRETFRRQSMHQFVAAAIALYNPDEPTRAVNSPKAVYQISPEILALVRLYGTKSWDAALADFLAQQEGLAKRYARERDMVKVPISLPEGRQMELSPGAHSELIKAIIEIFAPCFAPGSILVYAGDTGEKLGYFDEELLSNLGVEVDTHGKMPDVVLYYQKKEWLLLVESVTSHGPVDGKRHDELMKLFSGAKPGIVYVTAFPSRALMARYLGEIAWETEVWVADAPTHLIHFDGERFLGPYGT